MVFSSLNFVYAFLPVCILLAVLTRKWTNVQNIVLFIASVAFYTWGEPKYIWLFLGTVIINWLLVLSTTYIKNWRVIKAMSLR